MATTGSPGTGDSKAQPITIVVPPEAVTPPIAQPTPPQQQSLPLAQPAITDELDDEDRAAGVTTAGEQLAVPRDAFKKVKDRAVERGRKAEQAALSKRATALGFATVDEMFAALERNQAMAATPPVITPPTPAAPAGAAPTAATPAAAPTLAHDPAVTPPVAAQPGQAAAQLPKPGDEPENDRRVPEHVRKKLRTAREEMRNATVAAQQAQKVAETQAKASAHQLEVFREEQKMREDMIRSGIRDIDFSFFELKKHLATLDDEKLKAFELKGWVDDQRKSRPYLFGEQPVPANTGVAQPPPVAPPGPGQIQGAAGDASKVDARNLSPEEFKKRMAGHGIQVGHSHPPLGR